MKGRVGVRVMTSEALGRSGPGTHVGGTWSLAGMMTAPFSGRAHWGAELGTRL